MKTLLGDEGLFVLGWGSLRSSFGAGQIMYLYVSYFLSRTRKNNVCMFHRLPKNPPNNNFFVCSVWREQTAHNLKACLLLNQSTKAINSMIFIFVNYLFTNRSASLKPNWTESYRITLSDLEIMIQHCYFSYNFPECFMNKTSPNSKGNFYYQVWIYWLGSLEYGRQQFISSP